MSPVLPFKIGEIDIGGGQPFVFIGGPCVIESERHASDLAAELAALTTRLRVPFIFKASYDKANRTSGRSFRGPGLGEGLRILASIKDRLRVPVLTDIHEPSHAAAAADVADVIQIPAFLCRQTDLLVAAAKTGRVVNIKKGQFLAPDDIRHAVAKVVEAGNPRVIVTERGTSFGYHNLVVDMRGLAIMREQGLPVVFDVTHSLQLPGAGDGVTAGLAQYIEPLARAGVAAGVDGVFLEVHEDPSRAKSDGQNALRLDLVEPLLRRLMELDAIVKRPDPTLGTTKSTKSTKA
jgi:2-dehydro-3-deoxyphosphooctonate aldolase (KDO 8-P synthase)